MIYLDTETIGLHGMPVLLQYARDNDPVTLYNIWNERIDSTIELLESIASNAVCGFNLAFDWFHICKLYTTLVLFPDKSAYPEDVIDELGVLEEQARFLNVCIKPIAAHDVMLYARRTHYQSLMERDDIKIRRVPTPIAWNVAQELEKRIKFDEIYFSKAKDPFAPRWKIYDIKKPDGTINPDFKDIKLKFRASGSLKNLYRHAFKVTDKIFFFRDVEIEKRHYPEEAGFAPFALGTPLDPKTGYMDLHGIPLRETYFEDKDWRNTWPDKVRQFTLHWYYNEDARKYASDDVVYTRRLHQEHFNSPEPGDRDSELACAVACCRWKGYAVNLPRIRELREAAIRKSKAAPREPKAVKRYLKQVLDDTECLALDISGTKKPVLEELAEMMDDSGMNRHPAAIRAREVLDARMSAKEIEIYDKILAAQRLHAAFKVFGALSNRMSGDSGLNPQGIKHDTFVRVAFLLADNDPELLRELVPTWTDEQIQRALMILCGGDFKGFEVTIALRVFDEPKLTKKVESGVKVHGLMGQLLFPGKTYKEILESEGTANDMYDKGKKGFFLKIYFGNDYTIHTKLGIPMDTATKADQQFNREYPNVKVFQDGVIRDFGCLSQPGGIGTKVEWREPLEASETILGFKRYFTLENRIAKSLFDMAQNPPPSIKNAKIKVQRRDRVQTAGGAAQSALYAAAFALSARNVRAAGNNKIQSVGAEITKILQEALWKLQPSGVFDWIVQPLNAHDEIMCPTKPGFEQQVKEVAEKTVEECRKFVPLLAIDWFTNVPNWANKKGKHVGADSKGRVQSAA
jgi:hypothetical protein